jgi:hypothetical protein
VEKEPVRGSSATAARAGFDLDVPVLLQEALQAGLTVGEGGAGNGSGKLDPVIFRHRIQNRDGCSVPEEDPLCIHGNRVVQRVPPDSD